jgi:hypothetical protein
LRESQIVMTLLPKKHTKWTVLGRSTTGAPTPLKQCDVTFVSRDLSGATDQPIVLPPFSQHWRVMFSQRPSEKMVLFWAHWWVIEPLLGDGYYMLI